MEKALGSKEGSIERSRRCRDHEVVVLGVGVAGGEHGHGEARGENTEIRRILPQNTSEHLPRHARFSRPALALPRANDRALLQTCSEAICGGTVLMSYANSQRAKRAADASRQRKRYRLSRADAASSPPPDADGGSVHVRRTFLLP